MKILVVVDMQKDFIDGSLGTPEAHSIVPNVIEKLKNIDKENTLVLFTKDTHFDDYENTLEGQKLPVRHCIESTEGWSIPKEISKIVDEGEGYAYFSSDEIIHSRIYKQTFGSDVLERFIRNNRNAIEEIEFCGLCTDICVVSNALMARQCLPNVHITVNANCCAGTTPEKHEAALSVMESCQIDIIR